ncbi:MAG: IgGFc-binding protein [Polyangiaceae bacterium]
MIIGACGGGNKSETGFSNLDAGSSGSGSGSSSSSGASSSGTGSGGFGGDGEAAEGGGQTADPTTCAEATSSHSYIGCDYWPTVTANVVWSIFDFAVVVANGGTNMANITITGPGTTGNQTGTVAPGQLTKFYLPWVSVLKGQDADNCGEAVAFTSSVLAHGAAYHLVSSVPVTVYQFNALEYQGMGGPSGKSWASCPGSQVCAESGAPSGCFSFSNDASLLLPSTAMTGNYRVTGHGGWGPAMIPAFVAITAINANTTVNVTVSSTGSIAAGGGIPATAANGTLSLTMGAGDVAELVGGATDASDLSGSLIKASGPVQVITGLPCLNNPEDAPACDHVEESNLPAETLGTDYVVAQPVAPTGKTVGHNVRIYGNFANTTLTYLPSAPPGCPTTINEGEVVDCGVALGSICEDDTGIYDSPCGPQLITEQDFEIKGSQAFAVGSFSLGGSLVDAKAGDGSQQGDPDQSMAIATAQYRQSYVFLAPSDYEDSWAVIIAPTGTSVTLDGLPVATAPTAIASTNYGVIRVQLGAGQNGAHVLTASNPVGLQVMGYGAYTSYTYPGGLDLKYISPPPSQ